MNIQQLASWQNETTVLVLSEFGGVSLDDPVLIQLVDLTNGMVVSDIYQRDQLVTEMEQYLASHSPIQLVQGMWPLTRFHYIEVGSFMDEHRLADEIVMDLLADMADELTRPSILDASWEIMPGVTSFQVRVELAATDAELVSFLSGRSDQTVKITLAKVD